MSKKVNKRLATLFYEGQKVTDKIQADFEKIIIEQYRKALKTIRMEIADIYARFGDDVDFADMQKYERLTKLEKAIADELKKFGIVIKTTITKSIKETYATSYLHAGYSFEMSLNQGLGFAVLDTAKIEAAVLNPVDRIKWTDRLAGSINQLNQRVREAITQGLIQGYGLQKTAQMVKGQIERSAYDTMRIVRTESHRAQSAGRLLAIEKVEKISTELSFSSHRIWLATLDSRTRDSHRSMANVKAEKDGYFVLPSGVKTEAPGMSGVPEEDIHCRCSVITEFDDLPATLQQQIDYSKQPRFKEWADALNQN